MIIFGLTGSIGMGKSTAAKMLKLMGIPVHDSDKAVHAALAPDGAGFGPVIGVFPSVFDQNHGAIDRKKLGEIVFADKEQLKKLEDILHPIAQKSQAEFIRTMQEKGKKAVVLEIPLLYETGAEERVDYVIVVTAPQDVQRKRVAKRPHMTKEKFKAIIATQMPDAEKQKRADFVVQTGKGYWRTFSDLRKILKETVKKNA